MAWCVSICQLDTENALEISLKVKTKNNYFTSSDPHHDFQNSHVRFYVSLIVSGKGRNTTHLLKCVRLLSTSQTDRRQSSDIFSDIFSNILSDISSNILSDILSDISCDILSDISSDVLSGILSDISSDISCDILSDILSDIFSGISSDILHSVCHPFWHIVKHSS